MGASEGGRRPMREKDKIYTKTGDSGETALTSGVRVSKSCLRVNAYGDVDELNAVTGAARTLASREGRNPLAAYLEQIQRELFDIGTILSGGNSTGNMGAQIRQMEERIDELELELPPLSSFVIPGGTMLNSFLHLSRTVCRRAERSIVALADSDAVGSEVISYMNRLGDFLFVMARYESFKAGVEETLW